MKNILRFVTKLMSPHVKLSWIGLIVGCLVLVNCSKQDELSPDPNRKTISLKGTIEGITNATENSFEEGDAVGIYIVNYAGESTPGTLSPQGIGHQTSNICIKATTIVGNPLPGNPSIGKTKPPKSMFTVITRTIQRPLPR